MGLKFGAIPLGSKTNMMTDRILIVIEQTIN
jgi:hypothetical protein